MSNRHRRTRIYGANYDIGESYYKKQLNDLDSRKDIRCNGSSFDTDTKKESKFSPKVTFLSEDFDFNDKNSNVLRKFNFHNDDDEDHINHERSTYKPEELDISNRIRKINSNDLKDESCLKQRNFATITTDDYDFDKQYIKGLPKTTREFSVDIDRYHKELGNNSSRFLSKEDMGKQSSPFSFEEKATSRSTLRSKFFSDNSIQKGIAIDEENASRRANVSKARLLDLEEEIMSITNKQNEREKRNKNLKKILSEVSSNE